jgi:hydroxyacylglutathione hydrolase
MQSQTQSNYKSSSIHKITAIKAFSDNYIWAINTNDNKLALVDPGDATPCIEFIEQNKLELTSILITHHHPDHVGGIKELLNYSQNKNWQVTVYGPENDPIPYCDIKVKENELITIDSLGLSFNVIDLCGHTLGHIAYLCDDALFCGDTLFSGGCGRIFEGTPEQMFTSLNKLSKLPARTRVYCAHEYTLANLSFALTVDPHNSELIHYYNQTNKRRAQGLATIPTSILVENKINPFLRCSQPEIQKSAANINGSLSLTALETFTIIRKLKDDF